MAIIGGFDVHRAQITFDYLDTDTGEVTRGEIRPATRSVLRTWFDRFAGRADVAFAVEGCTGWRFVVEEMVAAGIAPHLAEPADTATQRGRKKRAKTDRADARLQRELLCQGRLPESWIAPPHVLEVRTLVRLYVALMDERRTWRQRIQAQLFHQGVPTLRGLLTRSATARQPAGGQSPAADPLAQLVDHREGGVDQLSGPGVGCGPGQLPRSRLLHEPHRPPRRQAAGPLGRPQAHPPLLPHAARVGRGSLVDHWHHPPGGGLIVWTAARPRPDQRSSRGRAITIWLVHPDKAGRRPCSRSSRWPLAHGGTDYDVTA